LQLAFLRGSWDSANVTEFSKLKYNDERV
jgi:hypothetical protein